MCAMPRGMVAPVISCLTIFFNASRIVCVPRLRRIKMGANAICGVRTARSLQDERAHTKDEFILFATSLLLLIDREQLTVSLLDMLPTAIPGSPSLPLCLDVPIPGRRDSSGILQCQSRWWRLFGSFCR